MSELREVVTKERFEKAYKAFMEQAEKNAETSLAKGSRTPVGMPFKSGRNAVDGRDFTQHFGQGAASKTPYMNWHVVSVYYIVDSGQIAIGIEKDKYPKVTQMNPIRYEKWGNRKTDMAIFYETVKDKINYKELYDKFIDVSEEVMGLS